MLPSLPLLDDYVSLQRMIICGSETHFGEKQKQHLSHHVLACLCHLIFCELGPGLHSYMLCNSTSCIHEPFGHAGWGREASFDAVEVIGVARSVWTKQPRCPLCQS